ncbi:MAG: hypothetical protein EXS05_03800 [Planctomycetaceae bacterium]|nr:hypothetical protein [Planctomycetaceae bacterium]
MDKAFKESHTSMQDVTEQPVGLGEPLPPQSLGVRQFNSLLPFAGKRPTNADLDSLFAALAANFDLHDNGDE